MAELHQEKRITRVPIVDTLRALAILWIASYHIWQLSWLNHRFVLFNKVIDLNFIPANGNLGVELFLFISGFGLFYSFASCHFAGRPLPKFSGFFKRRALRIVPSYLLALTISFFFFPERLGNFKEILQSIFAHLFFVHNLFVATYDTILGVLWIIGVFVQFYLLFPLLCKAFLKRPLITFISLSLIGLGYRQIIVIFWLDRAFLYISQVPGFLDLFLFGMTAAYLVAYLNQHKQKLQAYRGFFTIFALVSLVLFYFLLQYANKNRFIFTNIFIWQAVNRFYMGLVFCLFTVAATFAYKLFIIIFANRVILFLASISFHLFMWHQKVGRIFYNNKLLPARFDDQRQDLRWQIIYTVVVFLIAIAVSTLLTYGFERPIARYGPIGVVKKLAGLFKRKKAPEESSEL